MKIPGDKSISHRALILAAIRDKDTQITGLSDGQDCEATCQALQSMGVNIRHMEKSITIVEGVGLHGLQAPKEPIDCGNSGTSMRLLTGLLSGQSFHSVLVGDESLSKRPMARIIDPLRKMGAVIHMSNQKTAPLRIIGNQSLKGINYSLPLPSAQVKSCLLLASLYAKDGSNIYDPFFTRDHTERMLACKDRHITIPGDISSAAFFITAATIRPNTQLTLNNVGVNPTRTGVLTHLRSMGANIVVKNERIVSNEPVADIDVKFSVLRGIDVSPDEVVSAIDEFPILFIAAACAKGKGRSTFSGLKELRVKESDRISSMVEGLRRLGIRVATSEDSVSIEGGVLQGGTINSYNDHRVAMAFGIARCVSKEKICIQNCATIATSFPSFWECCRSMQIEAAQGCY